MIYGSGNSNKFWAVASRDRLLLLNYHHYYLRIVMWLLALIWWLSLWVVIFCCDVGPLLARCKKRQVVFNDKRSTLKQKSGMGGSNRRWNSEYQTSPHTLHKFRLAGSNYEIMLLRFIATETIGGDNFMRHSVVFWKAELTGEAKNEERLQNIDQKKLTLSFIPEIEGDIFVNDQWL